MCVYIAIEDDKKAESSPQHKKTSTSTCRRGSNTIQQEREENELITMAEDESKAKKTKDDAVEEDEKASSTQGEPAEFPPPKYVVTIVSPRIIHLHDSDTSLDEWKEFEQANTDKSMTVLNLHVLLVSLLNRLLRARLFPRRAVHSYITPAAGMDDQDWVVFSILTPPNVLPILLSKCEHFGVGNLVGLVYAVPLETCVLPLLMQTPEGEEEDEGLLTVPSQFDPAPMGKSAAATPGVAVEAAATVGVSPDSMLVMAAAPPPPKKTPASSAIRPAVSETFDDMGAKELEDTTSPGNGLQRSSSHPDILQTAKVDEGGKTHERKDTGEKILEMIPEAKVPPKPSSRDSSIHGETDEKTKSEQVQTKSVLIDKILEARKEWLATASRIRVEQVAQEVTAAASLTWDYLLFVVCAAAISATGLATNSSVTVLASMLVSPIMGPILAVTFGTMIRRPAMIQKALRNEAISLFLCILVGAFGGLVVWWTKLYESSDWPAREMTARGDPVGLAAGILIALPSGMATALSTLGKNSSGLVGVAISLSLLPPAVNAGLCWMFALLENSRLVDREPDDDTNYWRVGSTSFGLTLINIVCIWMAGVFTFWLKEVAPVEAKAAFWSRDLKIARQKPKDTGADKIKDGLKAAFDLKKQYNTEVGDEDPTVGTVQTRNSRRRTIAVPTSKWDDALRFDRLPAANTAPERVGLQRASSEGILMQTEALGGIDKASEYLFNNTLFDRDDGNVAKGRGPKLSYHPSEVPPEDVYEEILWGRFRNPKA
eukprot:scaffold1499_cov170-Amphora_coffeaeformis.AAC.18